ncbi:MAG: endolytic transglycosylase MltG [Sphingomonadales bacterium]|nr:endolytic transglycosylase MltG [Sphingomonadales bacterium]MDE2570562.1 endolytic transglycosylase MltG [Sphingomonadales bacterium]
MRKGRLLAALFLLVLAAIGGHFVYGWYGPGPLDQPTTLVVPDGSTLASIADLLETEGAIGSASDFRNHARVFGRGARVKAGEFGLPAHASESQIFAILQSGKPLRRMVTIPEGMPSIMVYDRLMAQPLLTGKIDVPPEGSVLPDSYDFERGESRATVLKRMQDAMTTTVAELWAARAPNLPVTTPEQAVTLASIVEKETGKPEERNLVAGLYENRLRQGMLLQADPTIIYPITRGKPLGRRIRQSEIQAVNDYNTYTRVGLPVGPITNPGRASIEAVLHPADTKALYMVADGTGGHVFADTLEQHNENVARWFAIRKARGDL